MRAPARLRRAYFDCRYGQLHVHQAIPPGGGFDEATALLCVPGKEGSGRYFLPVLALLGSDRSVYAPDLPGSGESDGAGAGAGPEQFALALTDFLDSLRQRQVDILAHAEGIETALAIERLRPATLVRKLACTGAGVGVVEALAATKIKFRELPSLPPAAISAPDAPGRSHLSDLLEFLGVAGAI